MAPFTVESLDRKKNKMRLSGVVSQVLKHRPASRLQVAERPVRVRDLITARMFAPLVRDL